MQSALTGYANSRKVFSRVYVYVNLVDVSSKYKLMHGFYYVIMSFLHCLSHVMSQCLNEKYIFLCMYFDCCY